MADEGLTQKKVCIIDDDADILAIYQKKFSMEGFTVSVAVNGEEGLKVIRETKPDVILLDLQMPVMNGAEVLAALEKDNILSKTPIILLTNINSEEIFRQVGHFKIRFYLIIKSMITPQKAVEYVRDVLSK